MEIFSIKLPRTSTLTGSERVGLLPSKIRTLVNSVVDLLRVWLLCKSLPGHQCNSKQANELSKTAALQKLDHRSGVSVKFTISYLSLAVFTMFNRAVEF